MLGACSAGGGVVLGACSAGACSAREGVVLGGVVLGEV